MKAPLVYSRFRRYDPASGKVELDGISLVAFAVLPLRELFGFVRTLIND